VNAFIGVPWKGRNFRKAAKEALDETFYDPEFLADRFNGRSKKEAKSERISQDFLDEVNQTGWQEAGRFIDTGRKSPRFGFDRLDTSNGTVDGYQSDPFNSGYDEVYVPDDLGLESQIEEPVDLELYAEDSDEQVYLGENAGERGKVDLGEVMDDYVDDYSSSEELDDGVSLAAMVSEELEDESVETVLVSQDLENVSKSVADYVWDDVEYCTFQDYADAEDITDYDEEELIGRENSVAGVYIVDSGGTADRNGLDYECVADTYLRNWTAEPENSFKELEKTTA
jgi:hypothetical protein